MARLAISRSGWLSVREAAAMLGISRQRLHVLIKDSRLRAKRYGRRLLVEDASMRTYRASPKEHAGRPPLSGAREVPDGWLLPVEAARLMGCSRQWVHVLIRRGVLHAREEAPRRLIVNRMSVEAHGRTRRRA